MSEIPSFTSDPEAALRLLQVELRRERLEFAACRGRLTEQRERADRAEAMLGESRRQVEALLDAHRHLSANVSQHRDLLETLRANLGHGPDPEVLSATDERALRAVIQAVLMLEEVSRG